MRKNLKSCINLTKMYHFSDFPESTHFYPKHHMFLLVEFCILCNLGKRPDPSVYIPLLPPIMETKGIGYSFYRPDTAGGGGQAESAKHLWFQDLENGRPGGTVWRGLMHSWYSANQNGSRSDVATARVYLCSTLHAHPFPKPCSPAPSHSIRFLWFPRTLPSYGG